VQSTATPNSFQMPCKSFIISDNVGMVLTDLSYSSRLPVHSPPSFSSTLTYTHHVHVTVSGLVEVCIDVDYMYQRPPNGGTHTEVR
jgi:hypothetical protein